jgi:hypothetical protein
MYLHNDACCAWTERGSDHTFTIAPQQRNMTLFRLFQTQLAQLITLLCLPQMSFLPSSKTLVYCAAGAVALLLFATQRSADTSNDIEDGRGSIKAVAPPGPPRDHVVVVFCISGGNKRFIEEGLLVSLRSVRAAPRLQALSVLQTGQLSAAVCML